jgi:hypothetical protein
MDEHTRGDNQEGSLIEIKSTTPCTCQSLLLFQKLKKDGDNQEGLLEN